MGVDQSYEMLREDELRKLFPNISKSTIKANQVGSVAKAPQQQRDSRNEPVAEDARETAHQGRCLVRVTGFRRRLCDERNLWDKWKVDALVDSGIIPGDGPDDAKIEVRQVKIQGSRQERTEIEISPL